MIRLTMSGEVGDNPLDYKLPRSPGSSDPCPNSVPDLSFTEDA